MQSKKQHIHEFNRWQMKEMCMDGGKAQQIIKSIDTRNCLFAAN